MSCKCFLKTKSALWSILLGTAFVCCSLMIYYGFHHYGQKYYSTPDASISPSKQTAAKLRGEDCKFICLTEDCVDIAYDVSRYMNLSVDPCEDFYEYACGNFPQQHGPESNYSTFKVLGDVLQMTIRDVMERSKEIQYPDSAAQKLKAVYDSCMDIGSLEVKDIRSMQTFLKEIGIGNWPNLYSDFAFSDPTFGEVLGILATFNEDIFLSFDRKGTGFSVSYPFRECGNCTEESAVKDIVMDILQYAGMDDENTKVAWESFVEVEQFMTDLHNNNSEESESCEYQSSTTFNCSTEKAENKKFICEILHSMIRQGELTSFFTSEVAINCRAEHYIENILNFLRSYNHRALAHYISLRVILNNLKNMNFSYRKKFRSLLKANADVFDIDLRESRPANDRRKFCASYIMENLNLPLGLMYVTEMFSQESVDEIESMVREYQQTTSKFIMEQDAIPEDTKRKLIKEIQNVKHLIIDVIKSVKNGTITNSTDESARNMASQNQEQKGIVAKSKYSRKHVAEKIESDKNYIIDVINIYKNKTGVDEAYQTFHPSSNNFLINVMQLQRRSFVSRYMGASLVERKMKEYFLGDMMFDVNAFNFQGIHLTFGILLPPYHKYEHPKMFKIAHLGETIAHEIGHTVYAVLQNNKKRDNGTRLFMERNIGCRNAQYSKFELKRIGKYVNANATENDDFADNVAVQVTERIVKSLFQNKMERMFALPGANVSSEELFYILYAQSYCETRSIERDWLVSKDEHSPSEYRVHGVFQNSKRFPQVFNCPTASYMNPEIKCPAFY